MNFLPYLITTNYSSHATFTHLIALSAQLKLNYLLDILLVPVTCRMKFRATNASNVAVCLVDENRRGMSIAL